MDFKGVEMEVLPDEQAVSRTLAYSAIILRKPAVEESDTKKRKITTNKIAPKKKKRSREEECDSQ